MAVTGRRQAAHLGTFSGSLLKRFVTENSPNIWHNRASSSVCTCMCVHMCVYAHVCGIIHIRYSIMLTFYLKRPLPNSQTLVGPADRSKQGLRGESGWGKGVNGPLEMSREAEARVMEAFWRGQLHVVNQSEVCQWSCPGHDCAKTGNQRKSIVQSNPEQCWTEFELFGH